MNVLFFLTPKSKVAYIYDDFTLRQTLEKMEYHRYSAVPLLTREGKYVGTITEGDLLWSIKNKYSLNFKEAESITTRVELDKENNVSIFANLVVSADAVIKDLSADLQNKIKERVKLSTDLEVKEVNITVKKVAQVQEKTK